MHNWSLIIFTLCSQCAIGLSWVITVGRWLGLSGAAPIYQWSLRMALLLAITAILTATVHLQRPFQAALALGNLRKSWLSREVVFVLAFIGLLLILNCIILVGKGATGWTTGLEIAACAAGGLTLHAMVKIYLMRTVPAWNHPGTPLEFVGSALLLGGMIDYTLRLVFGFAAIGTAHSPGIAGLALLLGFGMKLLAVPPTLRMFSGAGERSWYPVSDFRPLFRRIFLFRLAGFLLCLVSLSAARTNTGLVPLTLWLTSMFLVFAGEGFGRWSFYRMYKRVGM